MAKMSKEVKEDKNKGGRPKGSVAWKTIEKRMQEEFKKQVKKDWKKIVKTEIILALGEGKMKKVNGKNVMVYDMVPDRKNLEYLISHVMGKPKERVELDSVLPVSMVVEKYKAGDIKKQK